MMIDYIKIRKESISFKIVFIFLLLLTLCLIMSSILYYKSTVTVRDSVMEKGIAQAQYFVDSVDSQIAVAEEMTFNLMFDRRLSYLTSNNTILNDYELNHAYLAQQERLNNLKLSSSLISSAKIFLPNMNKIITDDSILTMDSFELVNLKEHINKSQRGGVYFFENSLFLGTTGTRVQLDNQLPDIFFLVNFDINKLESSLKDFSVYPHSGSLFYIDKDTILSSNKNNTNFYLTINESTKKIKENNFKNQIEINNEKFQILKLESMYLGNFYQYIPYKSLFNKPDKNLLLLLLLFGLSIFLIYIFSKYIDRNLHKPLSVLVGLFKDMEDGVLDSDPIVLQSREREFTYVFSSFYQMRHYINTLIEEVYVKTNLVQRAEMKQLQAQINPHFLYNSFFSLSRKLERGDTIAAATLADHLGKYFRFLSRSSNDVVSFNEEIEHARSYAEIQQIRFYDRIQIYFEEIPYSAINRAVPRLIVQPIIENAFKYGLENREENGLLSITYTELENGIIINVNDNGEDLSSTDIEKLNKQLFDNNLTELTGLFNIHRRIQIMFGEESGISVSQNSSGGMCVKLKIFF